MEQFVKTVPGLIITIGGIIAVGATGFFYIMGLWKKGKDGEDDRLINILKQTVEELSKKVEHLERREADLTKKVEISSNEISKLRDENKKYIAILQGRDEQTKEFYKQAFKSMEVSRETRDLAETIAKGMTDTNDNIKKLIDLFSKHVDVLDHSINN